jgi:hypothetical protein
MAAPADTKTSAESSRSVLSGPPRLWNRRGLDLRCVETPRRPPPARAGRPATPVPPRPGLSAYYLLAPAAADDAGDRDAALRCLEEVGATIRLPAVPPGHWLTVRVAVRAR